MPNSEKLCGILIMNNQDLTQEKLNSAFKVHTALGPGLLESAYQACLAYELRKKGLKVEVEKSLPLLRRSKIRGGLSNRLNCREQSSG